MHDVIANLGTDYSLAAVLNYFKTHLTFYTQILVRIPVRYDFCRWCLFPPTSLWSLTPTPRSGNKGHCVRRCQGCPSTARPCTGQGSSVRSSPMDTLWTLPGSGADRCALKKLPSMDRDLCWSNFSSRSIISCTAPEQLLPMGGILEQGKRVGSGVTE